MGQDQLPRCGPPRRAKALIIGGDSGMDRATVAYTRRG
jgi:hypothetical protein